MGSFPEVLTIEDGHNADMSGAAPAYSLAAGGLPRWAQVRAVSKHLGNDLRWGSVETRRRRPGTTGAAGWGGALIGEPAGHGVPAHGESGPDV
ncbi:hypothetical protein [Streptomyces lavendofoliae]|uniref:hypothetical protein n=1 Tax=Streptomyces lavendofoliae TaxID=67314 RepID=UPI003D95031C